MKKNLFLTSSTLVKEREDVPFTTDSVFSYQVKVGKEW